MLLNLKTKLIAAGAALLTLLGFFVRLKVVTNQRDKAQQAAKKYKAWSDRQKETSEMDSEIEQEFSHRVEESRKDREDDKVPKNLSDPNSF